jgi:hypothetical protein
VLREREFLNNGQNIFKIGRTDNIVKRFTQYPKGSKLYMTYLVDDMFDTETKIKNTLCKHFITRTDIGREYFEGDLTAILNMIMTLLSPIQNIHHTETIQIEGGDNTSDTYLVVEQNTDRITLKIKDPELIIVEFVEEHKDQYSGNVYKTIDIYKQFLNWCELNKHKIANKYISHKEFTMHLSNHFNTVHKPYRLNDGVFQCVFFPNISANVSADNTTLVGPFLEKYVQKTNKTSDILKITDLYRKYKEYCQENNHNVEPKDVLYQTFKEGLGIELFRERTSGHRFVWRQHLLLE